MPISWVIRYGAVAICLFWLSACSQVSYYSQSVVGHSRLMLARQPIAKAIEAADAELAAQLRTTEAIRDFAVNHLGLPDNGSYRNYVPLKRAYPVWTVVAADEFSIEPKQWCYLVIGCASYRGYFKQASALSYANGLMEQGLDVSVGGTPAYSTLGWFDDPVLPTMLNFGEAVLAETLFHELAHQVLYVNGDSEFNEAFATVVGEQGVKLWLSQKNKKLLSDYELRSAAYLDFVGLLKARREQLAELYASPIPLADMRAQKRQQFDQLKQDYAELRADKWQGRGWFDGWFERPLNNARLSAIATYYNRVPELAEFLRNCDGDFDKYYHRLRSAAKHKPLVVPHEC